MGMAHSTSGRRGFDSVDIEGFQLHDPAQIRQTVKYDTVKAMLLQENDLRLSKKYEHMYRDDAKNGLQGYCTVTEKLQLEVAQMFDMDHQQRGQYILQTAELLYPENKEEIRELSLYRKFNRMLDSNLSVGCRAPPISVIDSATGEQVQLLEVTSYPTNNAGIDKRENTSLSVFQCESPFRQPEHLVLIAGSAS